MVFYFYLTEPREKGPSAHNGHGVSLEPAKAKEDQKFSAQLSRKKTGTTERRKELLEDT